MSNMNLMDRLRKYRHRLNGGTIEYDLTAYRGALQEIDELQPRFQRLRDEQITGFSRDLQRWIREGDSLETLTVEAFALAREAVSRSLQLQPFDEQLIAGLVMHGGKLTEMQTGEGKTLAAVFPAYLNALAGKGVHVLTFNDYLAQRDANWMGPVFEFLGLSIGCVQEGMPGTQRRKAYAADITYLTAKEAGFDFLRDSLCYTPEDLVHRSFHFAIIDEADSILIDEARIPLVIAGSSDEFEDGPAHMAQIAHGLEQDRHFEFDDHARNFHLTDAGAEHVEAILDCGNIYDESNTETLTRLNCAIHAQHLLHPEIDYLVRRGEVELVDEFTGRVADKRRWPDGLQAAIEAKEGLTAQSKGVILNSISLQHFLRLYPRICGMTATAQSADSELRRFYGLHTVVIPPHKPCIRKDLPDMILPTRLAKQKALVREISEAHETGRPVLVGTASVAESSRLADALQQAGLSCEVLNARQDKFEAPIIAQAGRLGAITISTNMAGRGTDILLGGGEHLEKQQVAALGGLYVIGANRHESLRIDNQLRGRAGRQGDPGASRFILSLEDDLFEKFRLKELLPKTFQPDSADRPIDNPMVTREVRRLQRIIEGQNTEIKTTLCSYSTILERQRAIIFCKRQAVLHGPSALEFFKSRAGTQYELLASVLSEDKLLTVCRRISLLSLDEAWACFLAEIADIREGIHLTRLGGQDPLLEFQKQAIELFEKVPIAAETTALRHFEQLRLKNGDLDLDSAALKTPSATWTYLINDRQFEEMLGLELIRNIGYSAAAVSSLAGPLLLLYPWLRKLGRKLRMRRAA